ncbi:Asp-tRNA(Asn)/Glu-tRNA(Gln) amidotransferase subunit GatC [Candidatus Parcubacteria bacterium]|nr:MAG: Asp-tRNA(Asn)/Glu-tRNA(Gln) amidotransferase subunit GatC [Candidatus Parcubacteria bacterium]
MKIDIKHVAKLANLPLTPEEEEKYGKELPKILDYFNKLNELDTQNVEPTFSVIDLSNVMRNDEVLPSLSQDEALKNAPKKENGLIKVETIFKK